ncbi:MAG TPA: DUF5668 domain-containing protein [Sphingobacteriaceae bacterium]|nr:DUF5668 domain-containing protein [Sphingobacteriaceae bacterium]
MQNFRKSENTSGKVIAGFILLAIGGIMLLKNFGFFFPGWIFSWPMILIVIGLYTGSKNNFSNTGSYILLLIGGVFLIQRFFDDIEIKAFFLPALFIFVGFWIIFGKKKHVNKNWDWDKRTDIDPHVPINEGQSTNSAFGDDWVDSVSVFGGIKKTVMSKNFKGGEVVNIFGGAEINLMQADFSQPAVFEVTQIFGGTKIILPPHWIVQSEMAAIFGGIEDKRPQQMASEVSEKIIIIKGTSIFGGISIVSF